MHSIHIQQYKSSHFAPAFFFLKADRRHGLKVLYAVCRLLDDAVDNGDPNARELLAAWREVFITQSVAPLALFGQESLGKEFLAVIKQFDVPLYAMVDLIDKGVSVDLEPARFQTPLDTESYCYGVAGAVGLACVPIFGVPWQDAKDFAVRLGIAVQWINVIRDVGIDAENGRIYLPLDHLEEFGYTERELLSLKNSNVFQSLMHHEAHVARAHYKRALELLPSKWHKELLPARIMGQIYVRLLDKIEQQGFPVLNRRVKLNIFEKAAATWRAYKEETW